MNTPSPGNETPTKLDLNSINLSFKGSGFTTAVTENPYTDFDNAYNTLPNIVRQLSDAQHSVYERNMACFSALVLLSGLMTEVTGVYHQRTYFPNLFFIVLAAAASGKSAISNNRRLLRPIHDEVIKESQELADRYKVMMDNFLKDKKRGLAGDPPQRPPFRVVSIPADITPARFVQHLADADGKVPSILIEEEIDTSSASKKAHGDLSQILRKAASNETISLSRKGENQYVECREPRLALIMSGTFSQITGFIQNAEDGLYSRSLFYHFDAGVSWHSVAPCTDCVNLSDLYDAAAPEYYKLWKYLQSSPTLVRLTQNQWQLLDDFGEQHLFHMYNFHGEETSALVKRHALMAFKICMVLAAVRKYETGSHEPIVNCSDDDFITALNICKVSLYSSLHIVKLLPKATPQAQLELKNTFWVGLPDGFSRKEYLELGSILKIPERTTDRWIKIFQDSKMLHRTALAQFSKVFTGDMAMVPETSPLSHVAINNPINPTNPKP